MTAYYNEIDPFAAQWLRNLIDAGHIAPGVVDTRSIEEVTANDLKGFTQCHFFAGIGVWSYALRRAGWSDDRPVWTGSCPCQPFSACGKRQGFDDPRHHWPSWAHLIKECHPDVIFGEQVASKDGLAWLDAVQADLENADYAFAGFDLCAAGFGAPHIRQRLFWVADADSEFMEASIECGQGGRIELADSGSLVGSGLRQVRATERGVEPGLLRVCPAAVLAQLKCGWQVGRHQQQRRTGKGGYQGGRVRNGKLSTDRLDVTAQLAGWPTPNTCNDRNPRQQDALMNYRENGTKIQKRLQDLAAIAEPMRLTVSGDLLTGFSAGMESGGQLNPELALWLMGLPDGWASCAPTVMPSSRRSRKRS
ncbi:MAG: DNA cytosine methyltransferase [Enterobacter sp.]